MWLLIVTVKKKIFAKLIMIKRVREIRKERIIHAVGILFLRGIFIALDSCFSKANQHSVPKFCQILKEM